MKKITQLHFELPLQKRLEMQKKRLGEMNTKGKK